MSGPPVSVQSGQATALATRGLGPWNPPLRPRALGLAGPPLGSVPRPTGPSPASPLPTGWAASCRGPEPRPSLGRRKRVGAENQALPGPPFPHLGDGPVRCWRGRSQSAGHRASPAETLSQRGGCFYGPCRTRVTVDGPPLLCLGLPSVKQGAGLAGSFHPTRSHSESLLPGGKGARPVPGSLPGALPLPPPEAPCQARGRGAGRQGSGRAQPLSSDQPDGQLPGAPQAVAGLAHEHRLHLAALLPLLPGSCRLPLLRCVAVSGRLPPGGWGAERPLDSGGAAQGGLRLAAAGWGGAGVASGLAGGASRRLPPG